MLITRALKQAVAFSGGGLTFEWFTFLLRFTFQLQGATASWMLKAPMVLQSGLKGILLVVLYRAGEPGMLWRPSWIYFSHLIAPGQASRRFCLLSRPTHLSAAGRASACCPCWICAMWLAPHCSLWANRCLKSVVSPDRIEMHCISAALCDCMLVTTFCTWRSPRSACADAQSCSHFVTPGSAAGQYQICFGVWNDPSVGVTQAHFFALNPGITCNALQSGQQLVYAEQEHQLQLLCTR